MRIDAVSRNWLTKKFGANVCFDEPMARHTSLRVGGPAEAFIAPNSFERLVELVEWSFKKKNSICGCGTWHQSSRKG